MALSYYGTSATSVLARLAQYAAQGNTLPSSTSIAEGGEFLALAAAEVGEALDAGGFGAPTCTTTDNPLAYWILHGLISDLAAIYYAGSMQHLINGDALKPMRERCQVRLDAISQGKQLGEITVDDSSASGCLELGDQTDATMDDGRFTVDDEL